MPVVKLPLPIHGSYVVTTKLIQDNRGFFTRLYCNDEYKDLELDNFIAQQNLSYNKRSGTFRGMHYQVGPYAHSKLVRCEKGSIYDILLDVRPDSPTYKKSYSILLTENSYTMIYVPKGCAHGFITNESNTVVSYLISAPYSPEYERGIRYNDPFFNIQLPLDPVVISQKDLNHPDFKESNERP